MTAHDLGYFALGAGFVLAIKLLILWADYKKAVAMSVNGNDMVVHQPDQGLHWSEREARRVDRPLEQRSVPGLVVREVDIDVAHAIVNADPGSITYLRGARSE